MKFVDANVFIYAILKTRRKLSGQEIRIKRAAQSILRKIDKGEAVATSVIQISEVVNILSAVSDATLANNFLDNVLTLKSLYIFEVDKKTYLLANELSKKIGIGANDCLAYALMINNNIKEIYSFDKDFDKIIDIKRIEE